MTKKKRKRLVTGRQERYFKALCRGLSATAAAKQAGYKSVQSAYQGTKGLRARVQAALDEAGLTPEGLIHKHLIPALGACETEFAKFEGEITDSEEVIAWGARLQAIELVGRLGGYFAPKEFTGADGEALFPDVIDATMRLRRTAPADAAHK